jgi:hypothetical protein
MRYFCTHIIILVAMFAGCSQSREPAKQSKGVAGSRVRLTPPDEFLPSPRFPGYEQEATGSSIMITEMPGPYSQMSVALSTPSEAAKKGMTLLKKQEVMVNGQSGLLLHFKQTASDIEFLKWLVIFGTENEVVIVTATFPTTFENELSEIMRASILTTRWDKEKSVSPEEGANFSLSEKGEMRLAQRMGNQLLYTKGAIFPSTDVDEPIFVAGQAMSNVRIDDPEYYAKLRIQSTTSVTNIEIESGSKVVVDNLEGYEIVANARDAKSGQPMVVYQTMLFEGQGYFLMQGLAGSQHKETYLPVFKQMSESFKRRKL